MGDVVLIRLSFRDKLDTSREYSHPELREEREGLVSRHETDDTLETVYGLPTTTEGCYGDVTDETP